MGGRLGRRVSSDDTTLVATLPSTGIVSQAQGGTGQNTSTYTGQPSLQVGTWYFPKLLASVDEFGADPTGVLDSTAAIQAAIDSDIPHIVFSTGGTYRMDSPVVIDPITNANTLAQYRDIDGLGCLIVATGAPANCFQFTDDVYPNNHNHTRFHGFRFSGTTTGAFVLWTANYSWYNHLYDLQDVPGASATALVQLDNSLLASNPGGWTIHHLKSSQASTLLLTLSGTGLGTFDDCRIYEISGGQYNNADAAAIRVGAVCQLVYCNVHDILSGGPHAINAENAFIYKSRINRVYLEIPATAVGSVTSYANNWAVAGTITNSSLSDIWCYITSRAAVPVGHPAVRAIYGIVTDSTITNVGIYCVADVNAPYAVAYYPAIEITGGGGVTFNFPRAYLNNGVVMGSGSDVANVVYLGGTMYRTYAVTDTIPSWIAHDLVVSNFGQAGDATVTLPAAAGGLHIRFNFQDAGHAYHMKAAAGDNIYLDGTAIGDGDKVSNAVTADGEIIDFTTVTKDNGATWDWVATTVVGVYVDGGA